MNIKTLGGALIAACIAVPLAAQAQTKAPTPAPAPAPAAAPAPASPEQRTAVKDLFDAMNTRDELSKAFGAIAQTLAPRMGEAMNRQIETNPSLSAEQKMSIRQNIGPSFEGAVKDAQGIVTDPKLIDETMERMIAIYAKNFTVPELKQLSAFYRTPVGVKTLTSLPQANAESLQAGAQLFTPRITAIMDRTLKSQYDAVAQASSAPAKSAPAKAPAKK